MRVELAAAAAAVPALLEALGDRIASVTVGHPTLLDVFLRKTGREWQ